MYKRHKYERIKEKKKLLIPGWLFVIAMVIYNEFMLHIWITETYVFGRLVAILAFSLGLGGVLGLISSLFPSPKAGKWSAVVLSFLVVVLYLTEYFLSDAYQTFMTIQTILAGAGGVAQDYAKLVMSLLVRNLWRIGLMLLPIILYAVFCESTKARWPHRAGLAAGAAAMYLLGIGAVNAITPDAALMDYAYNFDSAVRRLGLNMALILDTVNATKTEKEPEFVMPEAPTVPAETEATEPPEVIYADNVMDIDFAALAETEKNAKASALHSYVAGLTPSKQNEYTGLFKGKNLILITAEAFSAEVIDPELTPTLYRLANEGIKFTDYYQPAWGASTTSGEYSNLFGLVPANGGTCMKNPMYQKMFLTMGFRLNDLGYHSAAYHNHVANFYDRWMTHTRFGYDKFYARYGGLEGVKGVWPESDLEMMDVTVPQYIDKQPFSVYYMTVSGHCLYTQDENAMTKKNWDKVQHLNHSDTVKGYYAANLEFEYAMESLVRQLEEAGIADDTVIVIATDHYPYGLERSSTWQNTVDHLAELYGVETYDQFMRDHNALIIWSGSIEGKGMQVDTPVYSLDILPTLSNLFGVEYDSRLLVGRDVFSDTQPLVLWPDHSWRTDKGTFDFSTGEFTPAEGVTVDENYVAYISSIVANKITYSRSVQEILYFNCLKDIVYETE